MGEEEPPDSSQDIEKIILNPNPELNEIAVLNPSLSQFPVGGQIPFIYRAELANSPLNNRKIEDLTAFDRCSVIKRKTLQSPLELSSEDHILINAEQPYEIFGCEDPRITLIDDTYYITYTGFDGWCARICLATTKDFKTIKKHGVIGPDISLEEAIELVGNPTYKKAWAEDYKWMKQKSIDLKKDPLEIKISDKDAILDYDPNIKKWILYHRFDPWAQIAVADSLEEFKEKEFWKTQLANIEKSTKIKNNLPYFSRKVGWGSPKFRLGDKEVMAYHGVSQKLNYYGTFCEIKDGEVTSIIQGPLLKPTKKDTFIYTDSKGNKQSKGVIFPTAVLVSEPEDRIYIYAGSADQRIKVRSTSATWLYEQLNHPSNRIVA